MARASPASLTKLRELEVRRGTSRRTYTTWNGYRDSRCGAAEGRRGTQHIRPENTLDADYDRFLAQFYESQ